jgi:hypothetical protein
VLAALAVARLRMIDRPPPPPARAGWRAELVAGAAHIRDDPALARVVAAGAGVMAISALAVAAQYALVAAIGERPAFLGVLSAGLGAGSIVAALSASRVLHRLGERRLALLGLIDFTAGELLRAAGWLPAALLGSVVLGFALPWAYLAVINMSQQRTPLPLQGRVSAAVSLIMFGPQAPLQALGSLLIAVVDYRVIFIGSAVLTGLLALWLMRGGRGAPGDASQEPAAGAPTAGTSR